jgi:hypothetical protein
MCTPGPSLRTPTGGRSPQLKLERTSEAKCATRTESNVSQRIQATHLTSERVRGPGTKSPDQ